MNVSTDTKGHLLQPVEAPLLSGLMARLGRLRDLLSEELGCAHDDLVFDEINDVSCAHCGKDFTG